MGNASFTKTPYTYCIKYKPQPLTRTEERSEGTKAQRFGGCSGGAATASAYANHLLKCEY